MGPPRLLERPLQELAVRDLAAFVPWGHHAELLKNVKDPAARLYSLRATARLDWTRDVLLSQIKARAYKRAVQGKKTHNFGPALPEHFAEQANEIVRSRYDLVCRVTGRTNMRNRMQSWNIRRRPKESSAVR